MAASTLDARQFRDVIGHYPTGVVIVTGIDADGEPAGLVVGSFTSASLDPPMVLFLPMKSSRTFGRLRTASSYCINVLAADQEQLCRRFSGRSKQGNGFAGVKWHPSPSGAPVLDGAVAWIDCIPQDLVDCGDHYIVVCSVKDLRVESPTLPLLFFQSGYGRFARQSLTLTAMPELIASVRHAEVLRPQMERLAFGLGVECSVLAKVSGNTVFVATATGAASAPPPRLGLHTPIVPPLAPLFVGSPGAPDEQEWLAMLGESAPQDVVSEAARQLSRVRERGWSLMLHSDQHSGGELDQAVADYISPLCTPAHERRLLALIRDMRHCHEPEELGDNETHDVLRISVPVRDSSGDVVFGLRLAELPRQVTGARIREWTELLQDAADEGSARLAEGS